MLDYKDLELIEEINKLKEEKDAVILVHNYQVPEIYEVADLLGDSFELAKKSSEITDKKRIIFCGVDFMAESAAILNPDKEVYIPSLYANCPMAQMATDAGEVLALKAKYPDSAVVSYVNTYASVKSVSDVCVTSSNAVKIVKSLPNKDIIFLPDKNLGAYVASQVPEKNIVLWDGFCYVHHNFKVEEIHALKEKYPDAEVMVHPESQPAVVDLADHICSTSQMLTAAQESDATDFIVITEVGMVERLKQDVPSKKFHTPVKVCKQMKKITLELVRDSLLNLEHKVTVDPITAAGAKKALEKMLEMA